jgi:catechol 2,3-dioxygenase
MSVTQTAPATAIDARTQVGVVSLSVARLDRSIDYYTDAIGLQLLRRDGSDAILGAAGTPLVLLKEQPGALPWMVDQMTGLYHFAILVPTRVDLGLWFDHYRTTRWAPPGQGDHIVSEALYLRDPDGHGIEVYADRPREGWVWSNGHVRMGGGPVDVRGLLAEAKASGRTWNGMPAGTILGHMHLQVADIAQAERFYHEILGFDVVAGGGNANALFVSAGGYHHHLGLNTWHSKGAAPAPADTTTLQFFSIALRSAEARDAVVKRLADAGVDYEEKGAAIVTRDPWQNVVVLTVGAVDDVSHASQLLG